jgi:hypothetical protein
MDADDSQKPPLSLQKVRQKVSRHYGIHNRGATPSLIYSSECDQFCAELTFTETMQN